MKNKRFGALVSTNTQYYTNKGYRYNNLYYIHQYDPERVEPDTLLFVLNTYYGVGISPGRTLRLHNVSYEDSPIEVISNPRDPKLTITITI